jgi:hypothetical protein
MLEYPHVHAMQAMQSIGTQKLLMTDLQPMQALVLDQARMTNARSYIPQAQLLEMIQAQKDGASLFSLRLRLGLGSSWYPVMQV